MTPKTVALVFGTRPEAIKMAPVYLALSKDRRFRVQVIVSAQHRELLDQVLSLFRIRVDYDLDVMRPRQTLHRTTAAVLTRLRSVLKEAVPDLMMVHGDTTTTMSASLAAYYGRVPLAHVEAGLRTRDKWRPFPEEINRRVSDLLADLHFAPTAAARDNLLREGADPAGVFVTGNTVVDAVQLASRRLRRRAPSHPTGTKLILVTAHRRESFGEPMRRIAEAVYELARRREDVFIIFSAHPNPNVRRVLSAFRHERVRQVEPLDYLDFVGLMRESTFILTDSGGIQEEAPGLGVPVLVMREVTERPEAIRYGTALLVGTDKERILAASLKLLDDRLAYQKMRRAKNPYGDGRAAERIRRITARFLGLGEALPEPFRV